MIIFCSKCKYLDWQVAVEYPMYSRYENEYDSVCMSPENVVGVPCKKIGWYSEEIVKEKGMHPKKLNKNNDCKFFFEKKGFNPNDLEKELILSDKEIKSRNKMVKELRKAIGVDINLYKKELIDER